MQLQQTFIPNQDQSFFGYNYVEPQPPVQYYPIAMVRPQRALTYPVQQSTVARPSIFSPQYGYRFLFPRTQVQSAPPLFPSFLSPISMSPQLQFFDMSPQVYQVVMLNSVSVLQQVNQNAQKVIAVQQKTLGNSVSPKVISNEAVVQQEVQMETASSTSSFSSSNAVATIAPVLQTKASKECATKIEKRYVADCSRCAITDALEPFFTYSPTYSMITFAKTNISDKGIENFINKVKNKSSAHSQTSSFVVVPSELEYLVLSGTKITLEGVQNLLENNSLFPDLQHLYLAGLDISKEQIEKLLKECTFPRRLSSFMNIVKESLVIHLDNGEELNIDKSRLFN